MPSWKKVIISGSNAELSSLNAPSITGSLQGTASFARTASFVTGSNVFGPFGSNSIISASYAATSSFSLATSANQILGINKSGFTITKGTVVHLTGSTNSSDTPYITTASYESDNLSANTLGIAAETITFNSTGYITTEGVLTGLNVTGFVSGQVVYLGANGTITGSAPIAPLHSVRLGQVVRDSPTNNGSIYVRIDNGYEIGELHDVIDSTTTASFGDLLVKSGSVWTNSKQLSGSYGLTGSLTVTGSTTTDLVRITQTGTGNAFKVEDSTNPDNTPFIIDNVGNVMIGTTSSKGAVTIASNGADGLVLDTDTANNTQSSRLFFKNSGSFTDFSIRNTGQLLVIAASASAGVGSGTGRMYISASGEVSIGTGYDPSATRGAALQVSGSINIEDGFAYKQDGENVIYIQRNTGLTAGAFNNTIAGMDAAAGTAYFDQMTAFGYQALYQSSGSDNTAVGYAAGSGYSGSSSTLIGWAAGFEAKASNQTAVGENAGAYNTGSSQSAYGYQAGYLNTGSNQTAIGNNAGWKNTATQQTAVGLQAGYLNIGIAQTALGQQAGQSNSGSTQTAVGYASGFQNSGSLQVAIGAQAGRDNTGALQTVTGYEAGRLNIADNQSAHGYRAGYGNSGSNQTAIGSLAGRFNSGSNQTAVGVSAGEQNIGNTQTAIGAYAGYANTGSSQTVMGYEAGRDNIADFQTAVGYSAGYANTGSAQTATGYQAGFKNSGSNQVAMGNSAGESNLGNNQTAIGSQAGYLNTGSNQTAVGSVAGYQNSGSDQVVSGYRSGYQNKGDDQTATGYEAGYLNTGAEQSAFGWRSGYQNSGANMTAIGSAAGYQNSGSGLVAVGVDAGRTNKGTQNTFIGFQAGYFTTGATVNTASTQSVFLGGSTRAGGASRTNQIVIGYNAEGIGSNSVVLGNSSILTTALRGFVGIGITTPTASLHINNTTTSASFLVEDSANPDTTPFIIDSAGLVGIGTTTPTAKFHVSGNAGVVNWEGTDHIYQQFYPSGLSAGRFGYIGYPSSGSKQLSIVNEVVGGNLEFRTSGSAGINRLFMSASGNVGIGTTTPLGKLTVSGSGGYLSYNDTDAAGNLLVLSGSSDELVRIDVSALSGSVSTAFSYGIRGIDDTVYTGYGKVTDAFMYASNFANGLNIINYGEGTKEDYIRFYAGTNATATPNIHIQGSGSNKGFVGINKIDPITQLDINGNTLISGLLTVGSSSLGPNENTLTLGARDAASEGGQLGLNAPGGTYTSASMIDNYQNRFRILRGTNAFSDAEYFNLNLHSGQVTFNKYSGSGAFPGTVAGYLAFNSAGNILTTAGVAAAPGGNDTEVQFNNGGALAGTPIMRIVNSTIQISGSTNITGSITIGSDTNTNLDPRGFVYGSGSYLSGSNSNSAILGGTFNKIHTDGTRNVILGGTTNTITGSGVNGGHFDSAIIGGSLNTIHTGTAAQGELIAASNSSSITDSIYSAIIASRYSDIDGLEGYTRYTAIIASENSSIDRLGVVDGSQRTAIIGGEFHTINGVAESVIVGGRRNHLPISITNSVILGGSFISGSKSDTVYMPNAHVTGSFESPAGNTIDSNALIQAGLLYLSNNF